MKPHIIILILMSLAFIPEVIMVYNFMANSTASRLPKITIRSNFVIVGISVILMGIVILYDVNYLKYKRPIPYSDWREIDWSDFRAIKRPTLTLNGSQNFAYISTEIKMSFAQNSAVNIVTYFHPSRSYTFSQNITGDNLLRHEMYHLHITEYHSRLLRMEVSNLKNPDKAIIKELYNDIWEKEGQMQFEYDDYTYHGFILGYQRKWQDKIDSSLISLNTFAKRTINY
ncbi:MAG: hypothetical protein GY816_13250 [Cytophagales bacterium]|nr:hypothetical protein [Cytophagales bacterium]